MKSRFVFAILLALCLGACGGNSEPPAENFRPVRFQQVREGGPLLERTLSGMARAGVESRLSFRVSGALEEVAVKVGDRVTPGQLIARLDSTDFVLQVQEAQAALAKARAQARNADANYERVRALYENRNASRNDLDAARAASESATALVQAGSTRLEMARSQLNYTRLTAPRSGAIASVPVEVNENVAAGQMVALLTSGALKEVVSTVPESLITRIKRDMPVRVIFDALPERRFDARVTEVGVAATGQGTTFPVSVRLTESNERIRPGMAATIVFQLPTAGAQVPLVAPEAVSEDREGRFAFVIETREDGIGVVHRRPVQVGELTPAGLEILSGLAPPEKVVTAGLHQLQDGQQVRILAENGVRR